MVYCVILRGIHLFKIHVSLQSVCYVSSPNLAKDDRLGTEINGPEKDFSGRHFLFDKQCKNCRRGVGLSLLQLRVYL